MNEEPISGLLVSIVLALADVSVSVMHFIAVEVFGGAVPSFTGLLSGVRKLTVVSMVRMKVVVYVATEVGWTVKPGAGTDEDSAGKPLRTVVSVWRAAVRRGFVISIGAGRGDADIHADLSICFRSIRYEAQTGDSRECKIFETTHTFTSCDLEESCCR
jgi:hypothetical protein